MSYSFTDTPTPEIYTLSLHDALPIFPAERALIRAQALRDGLPEERRRVLGTMQPEGHLRPARLRARAGIPSEITPPFAPDRKSTRLNSSHGYISYAVFCLKKKNKRQV